MCWSLEQPHLHLGPSKEPGWEECVSPDRTFLQWLHMYLKRLSQIPNARAGIRPLAAPSWMAQGSEISSSGTKPEI